MCLLYLHNYIKYVQFVQHFAVWTKQRRKNARTWQHCSRHTHTQTLAHVRSNSACIRLRACVNLLMAINFFFPTMDVICRFFFQRFCALLIWRRRQRHKLKLDLHYGVVVVVVVALTLTHVTYRCVVEIMKIRVITQIGNGILRVFQLAFSLSFTPATLSISVNK